MLEIQRKRTWVEGVTDFVLELRYPNGHSILKNRPSLLRQLCLRFYFSFNFFTICRELAIEVTHPKTTGGTDGPIKESNLQVKLSRHYIFACISASARP